MDILHFDKDLIVCIKPVGILSQADESRAANLPDLLKKQTNSYTVETVHRLDRPVGGVMVYARNRKAAASLIRDIASDRWYKEYYAVVAGCPEAPSGTWRDLLFKDSAKCKSYVVKTERKGAKEAILDYEVLGSAKRDGETVSLVRVILHTGRTHQIRVQFSSRGMPLVGDGKYGSRINAPLALWSHQIGFTHPRTGQEMRFTAEPPVHGVWALTFRKEQKNSAEV